MADSRIWKYLSIALMGILAVGVLNPQAFALTDSQLKKKFDEIWAALNGLTTKTNNLQTQINNIELTPGEDGLNCWDTNGDRVNDSEEDSNGDNEWNSLDCKGENGTSGTDGLNCWDLNGDGVKDEAEDVNEDGNWDALDCKAQSSGFSPNSAPVVNAGTDQTVVGVATVPGGNPIIPCPGGCPSFYTLGCDFELSGDVEDDEFTGLLTHEWITPGSFVGIGGGFAVQLAPEDELESQLTMAAWATQPITSLPFDITLVAHDGILEGSDKVSLTCEAPE